jgi:hypothetical protein
MGPEEDEPMHRYDRQTWQQIAEAVEHRAVVLLPVGDVEDHQPL